MQQPIEAILTGSDSQIEGEVKAITHDEYNPAYEFTSYDGSLHLIIARNAEGHWTRVAGSEPYFSGWVDELVEQINFSQQQNTMI
ncbi:hypothetical protein KHS38_01870 [Mucilaginibacter sp. Bleaf8]|uniref:hypothetical protein n=1 Tax=Mucilaginibacter sp. Bleaf8 TaxID=2834430 RepID=UPI001BCEB6D8|nr:hypothetical protein [Mucilaginibacter sp. Bleaf8]MBS7563140.1 hypothetical protein [Mucilaginibacter sp. Bleaf8]